MILLNSVGTALTRQLKTHPILADGTIDKNNYSNFEFDSWSKSNNSTENDPCSEIKNKKEWWQFWK